MKKFVATLFVGLLMFSTMGMVSASYVTLVIYDDNHEIINETTMAQDATDVGLGAELILYPVGKKQWCRWIYLDLYDSNNNLVYSYRKLTFLGSIKFYIDRSEVNKGDYTVFIHYDGNSEDDWLPSSRNITLHVEPYNGTYPKKGPILL